MVGSMTLLERPKEMATEGLPDKLEENWRTEE